MANGDLRPGTQHLIPRRAHKKSKNGCRTCKVRKVKCDERRPLCQNCERHYTNVRACDFDDAEPTYTVIPISKQAAPLRQPRSEDSNLCSRFIDCLEYLHLRDKWIGMVPSRIGQDSAVDSAALTMCHVQQCFAQEPRSQTALEQVYRSYGDTLKLIQRCVDDAEASISDATLAAVTIVSHVENMMVSMHQYRWHFPAHCKGISAILRARPPSAHASEVTRSIVFSEYDITWIMPMATGMTSPFETDFWLGLEPAGQEFLPDAIRDLQSTRHRLSVRAPRLAVYVRDVRSSTPCVFNEAYLTTVSRAVCLAQYLLQLQNTTAEEKILRNVEVVPIDRIDGIVGTSSSFKFQSLADFRTLALYWKAMLMLVNLALELTRLIPSILHTFDSEALSALQECLIEKILMSWDYAQAQGPFCTLDLSNALIFIWAAVGQRGDYKDVPQSVMKTWLLASLRHPFLGWTARATPELVEAVSGVPIGKPLGGHPGLVAALDSLGVKTTVEGSEEAAKGSGDTGR